MSIGRSPHSSEEKNCRRRADRHVLAEEGKSAALAVDAISGDGIRPLIARIKIVPCRIDVEAAGIVAARPFLPRKGEQAALADGKPDDAIVQTVSGVEKPRVMGNENFRSEIRAVELSWQSGDGLLRSELSSFAVIVESDQRGGFFLQRVKPTAVRMKSKVPRSVAGRQRDVCLGGRREFASVYIKLPNENLIQTQIACEDELPCRIRLHHVGVRLVVSADGETAWRSAGCANWT